MNNLQTYLNQILSQVLESYQNLAELKDRPGDLEIIKKEVSRINGLFQVLANKIDANNIQSDDFVSINSKAKQFLENYDFMREIETMSKLYSDDPNRLKNIRYTILKALQEKKLIEKIQTLIESNR